MRYRKANVMPLISLIIHPIAVRKAAMKHGEIPALILNGVNGLAFLAALSLSMLSLFTFSLVIVLAVLFGPLIGFIFSSLYTRVEWTVGRRLGSEACLGELYRIFAWSILPAGFAALFYALIMVVLNKPSTMVQILGAVPSLFVICCVIRNYWSNIIATHQFTRSRGSASIILTLFLFLILIGGGISYLWLFMEYGMDENLKSLFCSVNNVGSQCRC